MSEESNLERLKTTPVTELNFGSASTRRTIQRTGFDTLPKLLDLSEKEIDRLFSWKDADDIINLQKQYRTNPEKFAANVLRKRKTNEKAINETISKVKISYEAPQKPHAPAAARIQYSADGLTVLPPRPFSKTLQGFEKRARETFDDLDDRFESVMVYQAFEEFSTDLDKLSDAFFQLFRYCSSQPRDALSLIDRHLRNAFLVFVADRARAVYNDGNLWGNFFDGLDIPDGNVQGLFKQLFVDHIKRRKMPLYARDEETHYYFYTALLHGGLSADSWENLWEECILPLARAVASGDYGTDGQMDGRSLLRELKVPESRFAPKKSVLNILEKAPDSTIAPLFDASMRVAEQIAGYKGFRSGVTMLSSFGLPDVAMDALRELQEQDAVASRSRSTSSPSEKRQGERRIVYLPEASLQLDLAEGVVSIRWHRQQFPLHFADKRIDYYVDGKKEMSSEFAISVGKCILEAATIVVKPQVRYDVELKLMQKDARTGEYVEIASMDQTFTRSKPGCFEFIKDTKGLYRLRERNERITQKRRIAYIVKNGYRIDAGQGMTPVSEYESSGRWSDAQIFIYDIEPGSAGSLVDTLTGEVVAVWQERYTAKIDKSHTIGETADGVDLYGYAPSSLNTNGGLPSMTIETIDGLTALEDLDIVCICDGKRVSVPRHVVWTDNQGESNAAQIALVPKESALFDRYIENCLIEARQKSSGGKPVFRYRFAVIPIQRFKPSSISFDYGVAVADYGFQALEPIDVTDVQGRTETVRAWGSYSAKTLLKDEFLHLRIRSRESGKETDAMLALAAMDIEIPDTLASISRERPVCLADALEHGPSYANFKIISYGWRHNRAAMVMLGLEPLFLKELRQPGEHEFNLFRRATSFRQDDFSAPESLPLRLSLIYGDSVEQGRQKPAWTDVEIINCVEGIGIKGWDLLATREGEHLRRFDGKPVCDVCFQFRRRSSDKLIGTATASAESTELVLPSDVVRLLDTRKEVVVEISPCDWLGNPQREYATRLILKR